MKKLVAFLLMALLLIMTACGQENTNEDNGAKDGEASTTDITVVLDWTPNTNHTGLYVADKKGFFEEEGLNVEIIQPGEAGANQMVASGNADYGVSAQEDLTQARIQDVPIVSIGAVIQHNTSVLASPEDKNIKTPKDLEGKTYGGWGSPIEEATIASIMKQDGADIDKVDIVNMGTTDFFTATQRDIDFAWIYYGWTGVEAELRDYPLNTISFTEYSEKLDYYTPVLITNEKKINDDPEQVKAFMAAVTKGYEFATRNPEEAANILLEAAPDLDEELVVASQKWLADKYQDDAPQWGIQKKEVWQNYMKWMFDNQLIEEEIDVEKAFTNEFLPEN